MSGSVLQRDDNGVPALGLQNDANGQVIPIHVGSIVTGADGKPYAKLDVNASVTATNPSVGTDGSAIPASSTLIGASDGTNLQPLQVDGSKNLKVNIAAGSVTASNPSVGTDGAAIPASSTLIGGSDGTNLQPLQVDGSKNLKTVDTNSAAMKSDLDSIVTNTNKIPASPAQEGGNLATLVANTADLLADGDHLATIDTNTANIPSKGANTVANSMPITNAAVQGWIAATGTGTASQDDSLTFASQVRKVVLYNAASVPVPFEFDQTSAATSIPIQPGQYMVFDDILCTAVHVFPSALLPINTTNGLYVKGWK